MKRVLIITKISGQSEKFISELPGYLTSISAQFLVDFAFYPEFETKIDKQEWSVIGLSPEVFIHEEEIMLKLKTKGLSHKTRNIRAMHFGLRLYAQIFPALLSE